MEYTPRLPRRNVNVSKSTPLRDIFVIAFGALAVLAALYVLLGLAVRWAAPYIPPGVERGMVGMSMSMVGGHILPEKEEDVQRTLDRLVPLLSDDDRRLDYRAVVIESEEINAVALPGGVIAVFSGLLESAEREDELLFVLAHELGHFHNRDHLAGFGRGLVMVLLSSLLTGDDSLVTGWILKSVEFVERSFSRDQERAADRFGIDLVLRAGGDISAAVDFMRRVEKTTEPSLVRRWWGSHPEPGERIETFRRAMEETGI